MPLNTLGRYKIVREIARSNDVVYEAVDTSINRRVAVKELLLPPNLNATQTKERLDRFYREARAAGSLTHPNIVTIYEAGEDNGRHFIAMEFLEGDSLRKVLDTQGRLPVEKAVDIATQVCNGLGYAHTNSVVHRDVKPDNIQILPNGQVKITDFGIARIMEEPTLTADGQVFGTPSYMSPEQIAGKPLDCRTDIFSLGIVLYEMLAGEKPFAGDTVVTITYNIMNQDLNVPPIIPMYLERVIRRALSKDPTQRYMSTADMAAELDPKNAAYAPSSADPFAANNTTIQAPAGFYGASTPNQSPRVFYGPSTPSQAPSGFYGPSAQQPSIPADPFTNLKPGDLSFPKVPSKPLFSEDTRYFFKVFLTVMAICGILIFYLWALETSYQNRAGALRVGEAQQLMKSGADYFNQKSYEAALEQYDKAYSRATEQNDKKLINEIRHNQAECCVALGNQYYQPGTESTAIIWWQKALDKEPFNPDALENIANAYLVMGDQASRANDINSARQFWTKAQQAAPGSNSGLTAGDRLKQIGGQ